MSRVQKSSRIRRKKKPPRESSVARKKGFWIRLETPRVCDGPEAALSVKYISFQRAEVIRVLDKSIGVVRRSSRLCRAHPLDFARRRGVTQRARVRTRKDACDRTRKSARFVPRSDRTSISFFFSRDLKVSRRTIQGVIKSHSSPSNVMSLPPIVAFTRRSFDHCPDYADKRLGNSRKFSDEVTGTRTLFAKDCATARNRDFSPFPLAKYFSSRSRDPSRVR